MSGYRQSGFTIVEVILFLAISSALAIAVLVGTSANINQARYRDTIVSLQSELQDQFRAATLVYNSTTDQRCSASGVELSENVDRGTSECVVLGRLVRIQPGAQELESRAVVAYVDPSGLKPEDAENDIEALKRYTVFTVIDDEAESYQIPWESRITTTAIRDGLADANASDEGGINMLLLRSPVTNRVISLVAASYVSIKDMIDSREARSRSVQLCVASEDFFVGNDRGVFIRQGATVAGDVLEIGDNENDREGVPEC